LMSLSTRTFVTVTLSDPTMAMATASDGSTPDLLWRVTDVRKMVDSVK
jgi:hypothetical protein